LSTFSTYSQKTASEKVVLATCEAVGQYKVFTLDSGSQYYKDVNYWVVGVKQGSTSLTSGSLSLAAGEFYFNPITKRLYIRCTDSSNPNTKEISVTYRFFFGTGEYKLPFNLTAGSTEVPWDGRISAIGGLKQSLDDENIGVVTESSSSVNLINSDGYFDNIFDTLIWENQAVQFYSWFPKTPISEARRIFSGVIEEKSFTDSQISFKLKDFTFRLRDKLNLNLFTESDGELDDSDLNTYKPRVYGKIKQFKCIGIDKSLDRTSSALTITGEIDTTTVTFSGSILSTIFPGDELVLSIGGDEIKIGIDSITNSTTATTGSALEISFAAESFTITHERPSRNKNRNWFIADHKLREPSTTVTAVTSSNRFNVASTQDIFPDDIIDVNGDKVSVRRISGTQIVTKTGISPAPSIADPVSRPPIFEVFYGTSRLIIDRDWTYTNTTEAILNIDPLAEFNIAPERVLAGTNLTFTNGSRSVTSSGTVDLRTILKPRDWVRSSSISHTTYYEISQVNEFSMDIVSSFGGTTGAVSAYYKSPDYIDDDSLITVSAYGMESSNNWIKTPAQTVKHILTFDAAFSSIDTDSFDKADAQCDYIVSISFGGSLPDIRNSIDLINKSCFGSLYTNSDFELSYSILNSTKPSSLVALKDDDIISFSVTSKNSIISSIKVNYRPFTDLSTGDSTFEIYEEQNEFVNRLIGIQRAREQTIYLYEADKAKIIAQRIMFFNSFSTSRVKVNGKANFFLTNLNDKIYLDLDRLYKRYGGNDRMKIGVVSSTSKDGFSAEVEFNDLANVFNRVPAIAENTALVYPANRDEVAKYGYVLNNTTCTPDGTDAEFGNNLIG
jgi:hypothetical protein